MPIDNKQLLQSHHIVKTLIEATEHFHTLVKARELNQSIFILTSIAEGFEAVHQLAGNIANDNLKKSTADIEKYLLMITQQFEQGNLLKINEILQFSFIPKLKQLEAAIADELALDQANKPCSIGVFHSFHNPSDFYTKERVDAMVQESERQHAQLLFFTSENVDFENRKIKAQVCTDGKWELVTVPFPDVINNVGAGKRSQTERKLRRMIPFTSFHVGNKFTLPKRMVQYRKYAELLVPFRVCTDESGIHDFIEKNNRVVFKYLQSNRGENIYFVTKKGSRYIVSAHKRERIMNHDAFEKWVQAVILKEKASFIVQRYIHTRTKQDEPYHFRAHVQKNGEGRWVLTHIYPRIGSKKSNLSNVSADGRVENFHDFLIREYGESVGSTHERNILDLSLEIAQHLDKLYGLALDELGIDFAIDDQGRYWMHEANNGPQTAYHEDKRAVNTVAYAKYIAENGIFHTDPAKLNIPGQFKAKKSNLAIYDHSNKRTLGMLVGKNTFDSLAVAAAKAAEQVNIHLFSFAPLDIDFDEMLIRGHFYQDGKWVPKICAYPDVIFDRLKQRGDDNVALIYDELAEIPFTNAWPAYAYTRTELFNKFNRDSKLGDLLAPYMQVTKPRDVTKFIENLGNSLLKLNQTSHSSNGYMVAQSAQGKFIVTQNQKEKQYSQLAFQQFLKRLLEEDSFIIQQYPVVGHEIEIHTHLMKNGAGEWVVVSDYNVHDGDQDTDAKTAYGLADLLGESEAAIIEERKSILCEKIPAIMESSVDEPVTELAITFLVDCDSQLRVIEMNPNGPSNVRDVEAMAGEVLDCCCFVVR